MASSPEFEEEDEEDDEEDDDEDDDEEEEAVDDEDGGGGGGGRCSADPGGEALMPKASPCMAGSRPSGGPATAGEIGLREVGGGEHRRA